MATFFLVLIIAGTIVGSALYIAIMNHVWWKRGEGRDDQA